MKCKLKQVTGKSKKTGKDFKAIELTIGLYHTLLFPSDIEMDYLVRLNEEAAHADFTDGGYLENADDQE